MNGLFSAAVEVQDVCQENGWEFCFIGGLAVLRWGEPRLTRDVDLTILAGFGHEDEVVYRLLARFAGRLADARRFALDNRVVLVTTTNQVPADIALGGLEFEVRSVGRASMWETGEVSLRTCSAEDLIVHKVFAGRDRDWDDVDGIVTRQSGSLDRDLILSEVAPLLEARESGTDLDRIRMLLEEAGE